MSTLSDLSDHAARSMHSAQMLPPSAYTTDELLEAEHHTIFANEWICVGRSIDVANRGDYLVGQIPGARPGEYRSVIVVRDDLDQIAVFDNVCVHRGSPLLSDCGNGARITCPYHAWTFRLDGQLIGAPYMNRTSDELGHPFDPSAFRLSALRSELWQGFIFVTQDPAAVPLASRLTGLTEIVSRYEMAHYVSVHQQVDVWATNWKLLVENFMDAYHIFKVHKNSFAKDGDNTLATEMFPGTDAWAHHRVVHRSEEGSGSAHPTNTSLQGDWRRTIVLAAVFPTHVMQLQPDWMWYLQISPIDTDHVRIRWDVSVAPEVLAAQSDQAGYIAELLELVNLVNSEDQPIVEGVRRGVTNPGLQRGPLSYLEQNVFDFDRYIARRLSDPLVCGTVRQ